MKPIGWSMCLAVLAFFPADALCAKAGEKAPGASSAKGAASDLKAVRLGTGGKVDASLSVRTDDGSLVLKGTGREAYMGTDEGTFAGIETEAPNFTFQARIAKGPTATPNPKYGLSIRDGLKGTDRCVAMRYDGYEGNRCIQWFLRHHYAPGAHDGARRCFQDGLERGMTRRDGFWMKIERRYPEIHCYTSDDGKNWKEVGADYFKVLLARKVHVGLQVTGGGDGETPVSVTFGQIRFVAHPADDKTATRNIYQEYHPPVEPWEMHLIQAKSGRGKDTPAAAFLLKPKSMKPKDIKAILLSAGGKEVVADGKQMQWDSKKPALRKPKQMNEWQGVLEIENIRPFNQMLKQQGIVRVGGVFEAWRYKDVIEELAEFTGIKHLPNVPVMITGASFAGGATAHAANVMPDLTIAAAPIIIGMAGADTENEAVFQVPHMYIYGSTDGPHLGHAKKWTPLLRRKKARWANAPMWHVAHRQYKANALIYPFFFETMRMRIPADADFTKGPVRLNSLKEEDGWLGFIDTWETNYPRIAPFNEHKGDQGGAVWLPNEKVARLWQAFVSYNPRTIIQFPTFDGTETYGGVKPKEWHNSFMQADKPFELLASGPLGKDLNVEYYSGLKRLKKIRGGHYRVLLEGLEPGLHSIYAITTLNGEKEISRPVLILFQKRKS